MREKVCGRGIGNAIENLALVTLITELSSNHILTEQINNVRIMRKMACGADHLTPATKGKLAVGWDSHFR